MAERLRFPYMFWAHRESFLSPYCLSQSGMPVPSTDFLGGLEVDIGHPGVDAEPALVAGLAELFRVEPERVLVTIGASSAMHMAAMQWFRPGARVVAELPSYEPLRALPEFFGADLRLLERRATDGWTVNPEVVREGLAGHSGPGHVILTNLHNPTGVLLEADRVRAIAREADRAGGVLVSCEAYMEFLPNERRVHAFAIAPNAVSIGTFTKAYGLGALRVGWMILGEGLVGSSEGLLDKFYLGYVDPPTPSLRGAQRALEHLPELQRPLREIEAKSRPHWERWLRETPGIDAVVPEFGIIAFPRVEGIHNTAALVPFLQKEFQVDVVPGEYFGRPGHLRVGCGVPEATLVEGLARLGRGLDAWRARR